jgi:hypothetical protein
LLLEGFAFQLLHDLLGSLPLHANTIKGLRLHIPGYVRAGPC